MKFMVTWSLRETVDNAAAQAGILEAYKTWTAPASITAQYAKVDGTGGLILLDTDDIGDLLAITTPFALFLEYEVSPITEVDVVVKAVEATL